MRAPNLLPSLLGASCSIAFGAFSGTALFNLFAWLRAGDGLSFSQASSAASSSPVYTVLSIGLVITAGILGGMAAAKLSTHRRYLNAFMSAAIFLVWSLVLFASPLTEAKVEVLSLVEAFVLPIPCALMGAYLFARWNNVG
jgi:hypothetical protein